MLTQSERSLPFEPGKEPSDGEIAGDDPTFRSTDTDRMDTGITKTVKGLLALRPDDRLCTELPGCSKRSRRFNVPAEADVAPAIGGSPSCYFPDQPPFDIRNMIYKESLVCEFSMNNAQSKHGSLNRRAIEDIDSGILRTCRAVHIEALPQSYACSSFYFSNRRDLDDSHFFKDSRSKFRLQYFSSDASLMAGLSYFGMCI